MANKSVFSPEGNISFNPQSGTFTVGGNLVVSGTTTYLNDTTTLNSADTYAINADNDAATGTLRIGNASSNADISYGASGNITSNKTIEGNFYVGPGQSIIINGAGTIDGAGANINTSGTSNTAGALLNDRTLSITGDVSGSGALGLNANTSTPSITATLATVNSNVGSFGDAATVPNFTVNGKGLITAAGETAVSITASQVSDFESTAEGLFSVTTDTPSGNGSLSYSTGVFTFTPADVPNDTGELTEGSNLYYTDARARAAVSASTSGDGSLTYSSGTGVFTYAGPGTSEYRAAVSGTTGQINYSSGTGVFSLPSTITQGTNFSTGLTAPTVGASDNSTNVATTAWVTTNSPGTVSSITAGTGLSGGTITSSGTIAIDNTGVVAGTYGSLVQIPIISVNAQGQITSASSNTIAIPHNQITDFDSATNSAIDAHIDATGVSLPDSIKATFGNGPDLEIYHDGTDSYIDDVGTGSIFIRSGTTYFQNADGSKTSIQTNSGAGQSIYFNNVKKFETTSGGVTVTGNLDVTGNINSVSQIDLLVENSNITMNSGNVAQDSFIIVDRVSPASDVYIKWDESADRWEFSNDGSTDYPLARTTDDLSEGSANFYYTETRANASIDARLPNYTGNMTGLGSVAIGTELLIPNSNSSTSRAVFLSGNQVFVQTPGGIRELTPTTSVGSVERANASQTYSYGGNVGDASAPLYAGQYTSGSDIINGIKGLDAGSGITLTNNNTNVSIAVNTASIDHDSLSNFVANEHIDHSGVSITAGNGLTGGGDITATRTINVAGGYGISVSADAVAVANTDIRGLFSVSTSGDGSLTYNDTSGAFTYTGPGNSDYRAAISVSGDLSYDSGTGVITFSESVNSVNGLTGTVVLSTTNIAEGTNLYYTTARANTDFDARFATKDTGNLTEGSNLYFTTARARGAISATAPLSYDSGTGVLSLTEVGDISEVVAGTGLSGGATSGSATLNLDLNSLSAATVDVASDSIAIIDDSDSNNPKKESIADLVGAMAGTGLNASNGVLSISETGDIESVSITAGSGLTGGGSASSGAFSTTLNIGAGTGITVNTNDIAISSTGVGAGVYGDADSVSQITVNAQGQITTASNVSIAITSGQVSGLAASATTDTTNASNIGSGTLASARLPDLAVSDFGGAAIITSVESFADNDTTLMTSAAIDDRIGSYGYTTNVGDITRVNITAGDGLTGTQDTTSGTHTQTINVGAGSYIIANADDIAVDATTAATASKVVARDSAGNVAANYFVGTATAALYADLAENYLADSNYAPGTVVEFGGSAEVTASSRESSPAVAGVVSTDPAHLMNADLEGDNVVAVALRGRVPCKVYGPVRKGDVLIASGKPGLAKAAPFRGYQTPAACIVGKAISDFSGMGEGVVEILV